MEPETPAAAAVAVTAHPNPFNPSVVVACRLPRAGRIRLMVVDTRGREVAVLHDGYHAAGDARWRWDGRTDSGRAVPSGVYLLRLETEQRVSQRAVTLVK